MTKKDQVKERDGGEEDVLTKFPDIQTLQVEETKYYTKYTHKYEKNTAWGLPNPKELKSFIPGTVTNVFIKPGQKVKHGDKLVIFEAMKMLNQVIAPFDGVIKNVNVKVGDRVVKGFLMVDFE